MLTEEQREELRQEFRDDLAGLFLLVMWVIVLVAIVGFVWGCSTAL